MSQTMVEIFEETYGGRRDAMLRYGSREVRVRADQVALLFEVIGGLCARVDAAEAEAARSAVALTAATRRIGRGRRA